SNDVDHVSNPWVGRLEVVCSRLGGHAVVALADERYENAVETLVASSRRKRRERGRFDESVERGGIAAESFVVADGAGTGPVGNGDDEAGRLAADPACGLDVLGRGLRLSVHDHESEAVDVDADGDHVAREKDIDRIPAGLRLARRELSFQQ